MADERITREVTPYVEVLSGFEPLRQRRLRELSVGDVFEEAGRAILKTASGPLGQPQRVLLDPDADLYMLVSGTEPSLLEQYFEVQLDSVPAGPIPRPLRGLTLVLPFTGEVPPPDPDVAWAVPVPSGTRDVPDGLSEVHVLLDPRAGLPEHWPDPSPPLLGVLPLGAPEATELLPPILHAMGTGRIPLRELRLRIDHVGYRARNRRAPFLSEVEEGVAAAAGCSSASLRRELALRQRLLGLGLRRHLLPDPFFVTWLFRGHRSRGLVSATDRFPVPRRASRQEVLRGTPEEDRPRLLAYLSLLDAPGSRLQALADRDLFAVSIHMLPNPDLRIPPDHGGIGRWDGTRATGLI